MTINFLLPMKGHSERVPDKNMKLFRGKPLYHSILNELLMSKYGGKIYVDTDSARISDDLHKFFPGVVIIERPVELCGDSVSMNKIINHDLSVINDNYFLQTHSTNPLLRIETIDKAIEFFFSNSEKFDSVFAVNKIQSRLYWEDGKPINHDPEYLIKTQSLPPVYEENSNLYIFSRESFIKAGNKRIGKNPFMFEIPPLEALDIDIQSDFDMALFLFDYIKNKEK
jgi:CMP-N-acetylneuraminic acid synthetase